MQITDTKTRLLLGLGLASLVVMMGARTLVNLTHDVTGILPIANGGTNSSTQNWIDLTTNQSVAGNKSFSNTTNHNAAVSITAQGTATNVSGNYGSYPLNLYSNYWNGTSAASYGWQINQTVGSGTTPNTVLQNTAPSLVAGSTAFDRYIASDLATSGANINSPTVQLYGNSWNGSASINDSWSFLNTLGAGANPTSTLTFSHAGTSGVASISMPLLTLGSPLAVSSGGSGSTSPSLVGGTNVTITGTWPNQTITAASSGGSLPTGTTGQSLYYAAGGTTVTPTSQIVYSSAAGNGPSQLTFNASEAHIHSGVTTAALTSGSTAQAATTLTVNSTTGYPTSGILLFNLGTQGGLGTNAEFISYTGTTSTTFTGCTRGLYGTSATSTAVASSTAVALVTQLEADSTSTTPYWVLFTPNVLIRKPTQAYLNSLPSSTANGFYSSDNLNVSALNLYNGTNAAVLGQLVSTSATPTSVGLTGGTGGTNGAFVDTATGFVSSTNNDVFLSSTVTNATTTNVAILTLPLPPAGKNVHGTCDIYTTASATSGAIIYSMGSAGLTPFATYYVLSTVIQDSTTPKVLYTTISSGTVVTVTSSITPFGLATFVMHLDIFAKNPNPGASNPPIVYFKGSTTTVTMTAQPGSNCGWHL